jgi:hypothetical protein
MRSIRAKRRPAPLFAFAMCALAISALSAPRLLGAQIPFGLSWSADVATEGRLSFLERGASIYLFERGEARVEATHGAGRARLTYRLGAGAAHAVQGVRFGSGVQQELIAYPTALAVVVDVPAAHLDAPAFVGSLGRQPFAEPSGFLLSADSALLPRQTVDGIAAGLRWRQAYLGVQVGYIGLMDKRVSLIRLTEEERDALSDPSVYGAPERGLALVRAEFAELFAEQDLAAGLVGQYDFSGVGNPLHTLTIGPTLRGPIVVGLTHRTSFLLGLSSTGPTEPKASLFASSALSYPLPINVPVDLNLSLLYASGPTETTAAFPMLSGRSAGKLFAEPLSNMIRVAFEAGADLAAPPAEGRFVPHVDLAAFFLPAGERTVVFRYAAEGGYVATELGAGFAYLPLPDFRLEAELSWLFGPAVADRAPGRLTIGAEVRF